MAGKPTRVVLNIGVSAWRRLAVEQAIQRSGEATNTFYDSGKGEIWPVKGKESVALSSELQGQLRRMTGVQKVD